MSLPTSDIVDATDFCRACYGKGGEYEVTPRGTKLFEPCYLCRGSGLSTVRITDQKPEAKNAAP